MYNIIRMYVRSSAQARTSRRSLDVYARARIQYKLGSCETRFIDHAGSSRSFLDRFSTRRNVTRVCVYTHAHMHACVRGVPRVCVCMHACVDWYGLEMVRDVDHGRREAKYARAHS